MLDTQSRLEDVITSLKAQRDAERTEKEALVERIRAIADLLGAPLDGETEDVAAFGRGAWVYCNQHLKPHPTGWCSVSPRDKVGLGVADAKAAYAKCRAWGFKIYGEDEQSRS